MIGTLESGCQTSRDEVREMPDTVADLIVGACIGVGLCWLIVGALVAGFMLGRFIKWVVQEVRRWRD